ncbi:MAG: SusC/RagA family TonB-linked outer membrane protein [Gemmatimonadetes bacterium]|nr:SusC/RagA family TonB-linked outer membrane protein [Gemmatimonadota bacterium]
MLRFLRQIGFPLAAVLLLVLAAGRALSAQGTISGTVTGGEAGQPLGQARVVVVNSLLTATTDDQGKFTLRNVPPGSVAVLAMHVGYQSLRKTVTATAGTINAVDFQLSAAVVQLQEVVTTATGQQRRVEIGNSVTTLGDVGKKVEEMKVSSIGDLLVAKAPGVVALPGATLGAAPSIRIRGTSSISLNNSPIYVVDGVRYASNTTSASGTPFSLLNSLNPEEIQDIEIVKGPSAATLYGTSAANGVVVITTKKGRAGAARWNYFAEYGSVQDRNNYQPMYMNWGHAPGSTTPVRCQLALQSTPAAQGGTPCTTDSLTKYLLLRDPARTFIADGQTKSYGVNVSGGTEVIRYFIGFDAADETAPIQMPGFEQKRFEDAKVPVRYDWKRPLAQQKLNFRTNLNAAMSPKLDVGVSMGFNKSNNRTMPTDAAFEALYYTGMQNYGFVGPGPGKGTTTLEGSPLNEYYQYLPGDVMQEIRKQDLQRFLGSVNANWRPFSWMQNDFTVGMDLASYNFYLICRLNECPIQASQRVGTITDNRNMQRNFSAKMSSTVNYDVRSWMNTKTTVGADYNNIEQDALNTNGLTLPPGGNSVAAAATRGASNLQPTVVKTLGFFVQEQVALRDRLFLTAAVRTDQNSAFGSNFQQVVYPKLSASWLVSDESFFPEYKWLQSLRLRAAFGASGVQPGATAALVTFTAASVNLPSRTSATAGVNTPGLVAAQPGLPDLKPETSKEYETGFDAQFLDGRAHIDYTYYRRQSYDALISVPLAPSTGASQLSVLQNVGSIRNSGHEVQITAQLIDRANFGWDITLNGSHNTNLVVNLGLDPATNARRIIGFGGTTQQREGMPINGQWYRPYTYDDANKDGVLQWNRDNTLSEVHVDSALKFKGITSPRDIFSVQNGIDLFKRRLRLNMSFDYKGGFNLQDGGNNFQCNTDPRACSETQNPKAPLAEQARNIAKTYGSNFGATNFKSAGGYFMSGQFWRFRELSAVYQLPTIATKYLRAQNGSSLVFSLRNIKTWTGFTDLDPEINQGLAQNDNQSNFQSAPPSTYVTLRFNLKY